MIRINSKSQHVQIVDMGTTWLLWLEQVAMLVGLLDQLVDLASTVSTSIKDILLVQCLEHFPIH
jgi:hypothetical protein